MIDIYTDGACSGNPGIGGFAFVVVEDFKIKEQVIGWSERSTNNKMELLAVLEAIRYIDQNNISKCYIYSDSNYVVEGINKWMQNWKDNDWLGSNDKRIKNLDLWSDIFYSWNRIIHNFSDCNIKISHIKAHNGDEFNELADKLAKKCIYDYKKK